MVAQIKHLECFNYSLETHRIHKCGVKRKLSGNSPEDRKSYRLISLLCHLYELSRLLTEHIEDGFERISITGLVLLT